MKEEGISHITHSGFISRAIRDKDINFIAFVVTPWHAISLDATLLYLQSKGKNLKGMVLISPHINSGINVTRDSFLGLNYELFIHDESLPVDTTSDLLPTKSRWRKFIDRRRNHREFYRYVLFGGINWRRLPELYIINQNNPETLLGLRMRNYRHARFVLNDEGIGSYGSYFHMEAPIGDKWKGIRAWMNYFREEILARQWICKFHQAIYTTIFKVGGRPLVPNKKVLPYYNQVLVEHANQSKMDIHIDLSRAIVIAPSVYIEEKELYFGEDERIWQEICDALYNKGYKLYMKPHPRDKYFKSKAVEWHCELIDREGLSMEELCAISKPMCVIGCPSTALVTASLFYDIPAVCIVDMMNQSIVDLAKIGLEEYKRMFGSLVKYPKTMEELLKIIVEI